MRLTEQDNNHSKDGIGLRRFRGMNIDYYLEFKIPQIVHVFQGSLLKTFC